jgi:hypothetical protein
MFPIGPLIWLLIWLFRALRGSGGGQPASGKSQATQMTVGPAIVIILYIFFLALPLALLGMVQAMSRLDSLPLAFLGFGLGIYLPFASPHWLAWRVLAPLGWLRAAKACLWLACHAETGGRRGALQLVDAAYRPDWRPGRGGVTPWTVLALALKAEAEEDPERADRLLEGLGRSGRLSNRFLRSRGMELVAWPAARRGDWTRVRRRVELGGGRGVRLLRRLAAAHLDGVPPPAAALWLAWALAPQRRQTFPFVQAALVPRRVGAPAPAAEAVEPPDQQTGNVWLRHLRLLARGAAGRTIRVDELEELAGQWEEALAGDGQARILSRGLELGVQGVAAAAAALRSSLVAELEALAEVAEGRWSAAAGEGLAGHLRSHQIEGILALLELEMKGFTAAGGLARELDPPGVELERWHRFRRHVDRLVAVGGHDALTTAWFNGLRYVICNWPFFLGKAYGKEAALACGEMHRWSATVARRLRDEEIHRISSANAAHY